MHIFLLVLCGLAVLLGLITGRLYTDPDYSENMMWISVFFLFCGIFFGGLLLGVAN